MISILHGSSFFTTSSKRPTGSFCYWYEMKAKPAQMACACTVAVLIASKLEHR
ncbi:unnamed protein product [Amoebophrya sp. A25]|nr:unnamed protein product [Amoebophrya sp. A25]|eukprot:GSA25T00012857001.1